MAVGGARDRRDQRGSQPRRVAAEAAASSRRCARGRSPSASISSRSFRPAPRHASARATRPPRPPRSQQQPTQRGRTRHQPRGGVYDDGTLLSRLAQGAASTTAAGGAGYAEAAARREAEAREATDGQPHVEGASLVVRGAAEATPFMFPEIPERPIVLAELFASVFGRGSSSRRQRQQLNGKKSADARWRRRRTSSGDDPARRRPPRSTSWRRRGWAGGEMWIIVWRVRGAAPCEMCMKCLPVAGLSVLGLYARVGGGTGGACSARAVSGTHNHKQTLSMYTHDGVGSVPTPCGPLRL